MTAILEAILSDKALARDVERKLTRSSALRQGRGFESTGDLRGVVANDPGFEKVIELIGRPSYLVRQGMVDVPIADVWGLRLAMCREDLYRAIRATARVEITDAHGTRHEGTAWIVAPGFAITNRHVALAFAKRNADGTGTIRLDLTRKPMRVRLDFLREHGSNETFAIDVDPEIPFIADDDDTLPDIALLKLKDGPLKPPAPIPLAKSTPQGKNAWVAAIGYPAIDLEEDASVRTSIFADTFDVKRVSPGELTGSKDWYFTHDCSTLGGNSGSVLIGVASGGAVGVHFKGFRRQANYAVRVEDLRKIIEPILARHGVTLPQAVTEARGVPTLESLEVDDESAELEGGEEGVSTRSAEALASRVGYKPGFIGSGDLSIPHPTPTKDGAAVALKDGNGTVLKYTNFSLEVSRTRGFPLWTAVNIEPGERKKVKRPGWVNDRRIDDEAQVGDAFYKKAKLSRGHMVRRLDPVWGDDWKQANDDTHMFTNACPQVQSFNDGLWGDLEDYALYDRAADRKITVLTGPIFSSDDPELFEVQVPVRFWKIIAFRKSGELTAAAFVLSQEKELESSRWTPYQWTISSLEKEIGIDFGPLRKADPEGAVEGPARPRRIDGREDVRF